MPTKPADLKKKVATSTPLVFSARPVGVRDVGRRHPEMRTLPQTRAPLHGAPSIVVARRDETHRFPMYSMSRKTHRAIA
jgi:hypothetical protein